VPDFQQQYSNIYVPPDNSVWFNITMDIPKPEAVLAVQYYSSLNIGNVSNFMWPVFW
jgi:hypothetical protein